MDWWSDLTATEREIAVFFLGLLGREVWWFLRQSIWQRWVQRSHRTITEENRKEEEKTRDLLLIKVEELKDLYDPNKPRH